MKIDVHKFLQRSIKPFKNDNDCARLARLLNVVMFPFQSELAIVIQVLFMPVFQCSSGKVIIYQMTSNQVFRSTIDKMFIMHVLKFKAHKMFYGK